MLVDEGDHAFLADFGISRAGTDALTATRPMIGTVAYVAPEVIQGASPGPASDRYAFAATLFHCLTGDVVFPRGSDAAVLYAHASESPPRLSERRPELPRSSIVSSSRRSPRSRGADRPRRRHWCRRFAMRSGREPWPSSGPPTCRRQCGPGGPTSPPDRPGAPVPGPVCSPCSSRWAAPRRPWAPERSPCCQTDDGEPAEAPVPPVAAGAQPLGSKLPAPDDSLDCRGNRTGSDSPSCSIVQADLPGAQLLVPADGVITGWSVRGASGELALDVIRPRGEETVRVGRSQWESAGNSAPFRFPANLPVERGDLVGVELSGESRIGIRRTEGATTRRWLTPVGGAYGSPDRDAGTGFDYEVLLRAELVTGAEARTPATLSGGDAARAPDGTVRERETVEISDPPARATLELVEVGDRVALDLVRRGRRLARAFVPGALPGGQPIDLKAFTYEGEAFSEGDVWWVNPNSGRLIFHFYTVTVRSLEFVG